MGKFKVRTRYISEDIYVVEADDAKEAERKVEAGYHDYVSQETDPEKSYISEIVIGTVELIDG